ncbi:hypothetical protein PF004_g27938, partial [Phytophthora fragariae]
MKGEATKAAATGSGELEVTVGDREKCTAVQRRCAGVARRLEGFVDPARLVGRSKASAELSKRWRGRERSEEAMELVRQASRRGKWRMLRRLRVQAKRAVPWIEAMLPHRRDFFGGKALHVALWWGRPLFVLQWLVDDGAPVNEKDSRGRTTMYFAARGGRLSVVQWLVDNGAEVDGKSSGNTTALHVAARGGHLPLVQWLLDNGAQVDEKSSGDGTALHYAVIGGHLSVVQWLVDEGAQVDAIGWEGGTALHWAAEGGHLSMMQWLVDMGAQLDDGTGFGITALRRAAGGGHLSVVRWLVDKGARVDQEGERGAPALHCAAKRGHLSVVQWLVDKGARVDVKDGAGDTALHCAATEGHLSVVQCLVEKGAEVDAMYWIHGTALHCAAKRGHLSVVQWLADKGARRGWTPLHCAAAAGHERIVIFLIKKGGEMNAETIAGKTALVLAVERGHADVMKFLMNYGASISEGLPVIVDGDTQFVSGATPNPNLNEADWLIDPSDVQLNIEPGLTGIKIVEGTWLGTPIEVKKIIKCEKTKNFVEELHRWSNLNHPHVVKLFGVCYAGEPFFVYERAVNGSLRKYCGNPENKPKVWDKLYEAALGLQYLHDRNIVHGVLCCESVVVAANGVAKLRNFGGDADDNAYYCYLEDSKAVPCSADWTAPEVLSGFPLSFESDVFAFGMCIVEAFKDINPWGYISGGSAAIIEAIRAGKLPAKPDEMSTSQWNLVERVCCYNARDRLTSSDVVRELEVFTLEYELGQHESSNCGDCDRGPISWTELGDVQVLISNLCDSLDAST